MVFRSNCKPYLPWDGSVVAITGECAVVIRTNHGVKINPTIVGFPHYNSPPGTTEAEIQPQLIILYKTNGQTNGIVCGEGRGGGVTFTRAPALSNNSTVETLPSCAAAMRGVSLVSVLASIFAPLMHSAGKGTVIGWRTRTRARGLTFLQWKGRNPKRSTCPCCAAMHRAVNCCLFLASILAPAATRLLARSSLPLKEAMRRGVNSWSVVASMSAPAFRRAAAACFL